MSNRQVFNLSNAKCAGCVNKIQTKLTSLTVVSDAKVNLLEKTLTVDFINEPNNDEVIKAVESLGFGASIARLEDNKPQIISSIVLPIVLSIVMMIFTMSHYYVELVSQPKFLIVIGGLFAVISLVMILLSGLKIIKNGYIGFRTLNPNMHSLILLGISSAWVYSTLSLIISLNYPEKFWHSYFDSSLMILGFVNLGAYIEDRAKKSTLQSISALAELVPEMVTVLRDNQENIIASNLLRSDDLVLVRPGDKIAADGIITSGNGCIDEAMLTGESIPNNKTIGENVIGGSINTTGTFIFKVTEAGTSTLLANIINLVRDAQLKKPKLAKLADDIAKIFVPTVILIAVVAGISWYLYSPEEPLYHATNIFMSILLVACPCSVGLAIPVSLMVGVGRAATLGIVFRDPSALSDADKINTVIFDKTGTLTYGKPEVVNYKYHESVTDNIVDEIMAIMNKSLHPLSQAIVTKFGVDVNSEVINFISKDGYGVTGVVNGNSYYVGSLEYILQAAKDCCDIVETNDSSQVYVVSNGIIIARYDLRDTIRDDAKDLIKLLKDNRLKVIMLTGDNNLVASKVANELCLDDFVANCKPHDKLQYINDLQNSGNYVAFVGDGINDAPSLMSATLGLAVCNGSSIAKESAAISLLNDKLITIWQALVFSRKINQNMRQNLYGAFIYNFFAIAIAAGFLSSFGVLLNPMLASIIMSCSSILVIANAIRLKAMDFVL